MIQLGNDGKVQAYGTLLELESRAREFAGLVLRLKDQVLNRSEIIPPEVVASIDDLIWHLRKSAKLLPALERAVGVQRSNVRRGGSVARPTVAEEALRGTTKAVSVTELLGLLGTQGKTGTLWLKTDEEVFLLEFVDGAVVHAGTNRPVAAERIGTILVAQNKISQKRLLDELAKANVVPIGETMLKAELFSENDLRDALEHQVQSLFHRIYGIEDARFAFRDGAVSDVEKRVCLCTTQLLLESARCIDEQARDEEREALAADDEDVDTCLDWMEQNDAAEPSSDAASGVQGRTVATVPEDAEGLAAADDPDAAEPAELAEDAVASEDGDADAKVEADADAEADAEVEVEVEAEAEAEADAEDATAGATDESAADGTGDPKPVSDTTD
jgi:Domain of unknown function (DUF4388)